MKNFVKGALFGLCFLPILECVLQIIQQFTGHVCTWIATKTYKISKDLPQNQEECGCENTFAIGFQAPSTPDDEYYDDEDDE